MTFLFVEAGAYWPLAATAMPRLGVHFSAHMGSPPVLRDTVSTVVFKRNQETLALWAVLQRAPTHGH